MRLAFDLGETYRSILFQNLGTVEEILDMYDDPEAYFTDQTRKVSKLYKEHSLNQLKKEFRYLSACIITKVYTQNNGLFVPSVRDLRRFKGKDGKRKTRRPDHECPQPGIKKSLHKS